MTQTYWLSFCDPEKPEGAQFLGAVVIDVDEADVARSAGATNAIRQQHQLPPVDADTLWMAAAVWNSHRLHCNPGGEVATMRLDDVPGFASKSASYPRGQLLSRADVQAIDAAIPRES